MSGENGNTSNTTSSRESSPNPRQRNNNRRNNTQGTPSNPFGYKGECDKVGGILALKVERFSKKVSYEVFVEKLCNYIVKKYPDGADIKPLIMEGKDPVKLYENKNMLTPLSDDEKNEPMLEAIMREEIKQYVARKNNIRPHLGSM